MIGTFLKYVCSSLPFKIVISLSLMTEDCDACFNEHQLLCPLGSLCIASFTSTPFGPYHNALWPGFISGGLFDFLQSVSFYFLLPSIDTVRVTLTPSFRPVACKKWWAREPAAQDCSIVIEVRFWEGGYSLMEQSTWRCNSQRQKQLLVSLCTALALKGFLLCIENTSLQCFWNF